MDAIFDWVVNVVCHRIGAGLLKLFSGGRFEAESGYAWGLSLLVGVLVLLAPFAAFIAWLIYVNQG